MASPPPPWQGQRRTGSLGRSPSRACPRTWTGRGRRRPRRRTTARSDAGRGEARRAGERAGGTVEQRWGAARGGRGCAWSVWRKVARPPAEQPEMTTSVAWLRPCGRGGAERCGGGGSGGAEHPAHVEVGGAQARLVEERGVQGLAHPLAAEVERRVLVRCPGADPAGVSSRSGDARRQVQGSVVQGSEPPCWHTGDGLVVA